MKPKVDYLYNFYYEQLKKIAISRFKWLNLPASCNAEKLENDLFYYGLCSFLNTNDYGLINLNATMCDGLNFYNLPISANCYSVSFPSTIKYVDYIGEKGTDSCVLCYNNKDYLSDTLIVDHYAKRLREIERTLNCNVKAMKTPIVLETDQKTKLSINNAYEQYEEGEPVIIVNKNMLAQNGGFINVINTNVPYYLDKLSDYKRIIFNEFLSIMGIDNVNIDKKERLTAGEVTQNNENLNINLNYYLEQRKKCAEILNKKYDLNVQVEFNYKDGEENEQIYDRVEIPN